MNLYVKHVRLNDKIIFQIYVHQYFGIGKGFILIPPSTKALACTSILCFIKMELNFLCLIVLFINHL